MIEHGQYDTATFMAELKEMVSAVVEHVKSDNSNQKVTIEVDSNKAATEAPAEKTKKAPKKRTTKVDVSSLLCPVCKKGHLLKGKTAYGCSEWKGGCSFRLPFVIMDYTLTDADVKNIVTGKKISINGKQIGLTNNGIPGEL